jgi:hypothetical protein
VGKKFVLGEFYSEHEGGMVAVSLEGEYLGSLVTGSGRPTIVGFSGTCTCDAEHAGAYYQALDLTTGERVDDDTALNVCPPAKWPPKYVFGISKKILVSWPGTGD